ncbi:protein-S-isoprenylcysteine O-methyltransferase Ste14 [Actinocorallia herbida]|uniref:Protein-S-isoprenylcysteine O-methyltransferase Ste14 n=1 Tax=Actinocorallia herbida TaxID=58109 RepID=A0A3N1CYD2_9ACTN|nr:isoprenylcysteine carboxylmethyltransferase family protein [Actinocorallia herbida]ROO86265.1 protein-S-isoprenylcysteine O-methyltransferase Ste14 [Actinocorallia herbida]
MAVTALAVFTIWALVGFGLRAWIQLRSTGDTGFRVGGVTGAQRAVAALLAVGLLCCAAGPVAALAGLGGLDHPALAFPGMVVAVCGIAATLAAQLSMGPSWRVGVDPGERTHLVTDGPFAHVRNPIYTAMLATLAGLAAMTPNLPSLVGLALVLLAIEVQVRAVEEPHLRRIHGVAYTAYAARTGRFLPAVGRG